MLLLLLIILVLVGKIRFYLVMIVPKRNIIVNLMDLERALGLIRTKTMDPVQKLIVRKLASLTVVWKLVL